MFTAGNTRMEILQAYHMARPLGLTLVLLFTLMANAHETSAGPFLIFEPPKNDNLNNILLPFTTDGCSMFPDGTIWDSALWRECCVAHDLAYWKGGDYWARMAADEALLSCVDDLGEPVIGVMMLLGVRIGGSPFWPTHFKWGYGWEKWRGYQALTPQEIKMVVDVLIDQQLLQPDNAQ